MRNVRILLSLHTAVGYHGFQAAKFILFNAFFFFVEYLFFLQVRLVNIASSVKPRYLIKKSVDF